MCRQTRRLATGLGIGRFDWLLLLDPVASDAPDCWRDLAGRVLAGSREMRALGVESAYSVVELVGEERAFADPAGALADLAERVARTWSR